MCRLTIAFAALASAAAGSAAATRPHFIDVQLIAESIVPKAGQTVLLGLEMTPQRGWHGYWSNPGQSGLAPVVKWTAPKGVHFGPLQHPAPELLSAMGLTSYVHSGPHILVVRMTLPRGLPPGTALPIAADVNWAACSDRLCVPEKARLSLRMNVGRGSDSPQAVLLRAALAKEPMRAVGGSFSIRGGQITLSLPSSLTLQPARARFFPDQNGYWNPIKAKAVSARPLALASPAGGKAPNVITGVVSDGSSAYRVRLAKKRG